MRLIFLFILLASCSYKFPSPYRGGLPTSTAPAQVSVATSLPFNDYNSNSLEIDLFDGYPDSKVVGYKLPEDTVVSAFFQNEMQGLVPFGYKNNDVLYPGAVWVSVDKLIDEIEITNLNWAEFMHHMKRDSGDAVFNNMLPDPQQLPRQDYFTNPFFRFYPVVGITHEQAEAYCRWRTAIVNELNKAHMASRGAVPPKPFTLEFRLPTEKEWETYAACGMDVSKFQGVKFTSSEIRVKPRAASYLKIKNELTQSTDQIKSDIKAFNKRKETLVMFNIDRTNATYFLANNTPFYVYDLPINNYGLYNIIGNVAELVKEKGIVKGGSYRDKLEDTSIDKKGTYTGASPTVGFRAVCEIKYSE